MTAPWGRAVEKGGHVSEFSERSRRDDILPERRRHAPRRAVSLLAIGCLLAAGSGALHVASADSTTSASFVAGADAYVDSSAPDTNFGTAQELRTANFPVDQRSFLRFHTSGITGTVRQASLRLYANWTNPVGVAVRAVLDPTWTESTVT